MTHKRITTKLAALAAMALLCCSAMVTINVAQAQPPCNPCDFNINVGTDWHGCPDCGMDPCFSDPTQFCSNTSTFVVTCGPNMCKYVDSIVITPPSGVCYSLCGATDSPTHQSWNSNHGSCNGGSGTLAPGISPPPLGPGGALIFKLCCSSTGNTFTMSVYSAGSTIPCNNHFSN